MPSLSDMPEMPVLRAFIRETLRWRPAVPTGIPHHLTKDDTYNGYHLPAGSTVHAFEWSISRDPEVFTDPDAFNPLRWLDPSYPTFREPLNKYPTITNYSQFGYGRRTCQGMGVVDADLFVGLGSVAWLFSIQAEPGTAVTQTASIQASISDYRRNVCSQFSDSSSQSPSTGSFGSDDGHVEDMHHNLGEPIMTLFNDSAISIPGEYPKEEGAKTVVAMSTQADNSRIELSGLPAIVEEAASILSTTDFSKDMKDRALDSPEPTQRNEATEPLEVQQSQETFYNVPGSYDLLCRESSQHDATTPKKSSMSYANDPTMNFSTLLIAKPVPFKFQLRIRNQARAEYVAQQWIQKEIGGEYEASKVYWQNGTAGNEQCG